MATYPCLCRSTVHGVHGHERGGHWSGRDRAGRCRGGHVDAEVWPGRCVRARLPWWRRVPSTSTALRASSGQARYGAEGAYPRLASSVAMEGVQGSTVACARALEWSAPPCPCEVTEEGNVRVWLSSSPLSLDFSARGQW